TPSWTNQPWLHNLNQTASGKPGAVQCPPEEPPWPPGCCTEASGIDEIVKQDEFTSGREIPQLNFTKN
ncbi:MAG: hypothetical protein QHC90_14480, partial [Shinella sp.]|nr:hypothetical protein [Shinella sp.]